MTRQKNVFEPLSPDETANFSFSDYNLVEDDQKKDRQAMPQIGVSGRLTAVQVTPGNNSNGRIEATQANTARLITNREVRNQEAYYTQQAQNIQAPRPAAPQQQDALCRVSFVGPDLQWYSIKIGHGSPNPTQPTPAMPTQAQMQAPAWQQAPIAQAMPAQALPAPAPWQQSTMTQIPAPAAPWQQVSPAQALPTQAPWQQASPAQAQLYPGWAQSELGEPNIRTSEKAASVEKPEKEESSKDFLLQIVQPGLTGLMDGSVSTLAPIFSVAFATHNPFTTFLVGMASALGAGISMTFSEALSDDGELTGRGKPFLRGGVTGLMTFLSGAGHALPFLIPHLQIALYAAYAVVAVELFAIAAIRHRFFGTGWWLSIVQVVGGGALVFLVSLLLGNA